MDLKQEKQILIERLREVEDEGLIRAVKRVLDQGVGEAGEGSLESYNDDISRGEEEIAKGYGVDHDEVVDTVSL